MFSKTNYLYVTMLIIFLLPGVIEKNQLKEQAVEINIVPCGYNYNKILNDSILNSSQKIFTDNKRMINYKKSY